MADATSEKKLVYELNEQEKRLIQMIREMKFGELHLYISEGKPVRAEEIKKSINFSHELTEQRRFSIYRTN
jgi:hypothetical protein